MNETITSGGYACAVCGMWVQHGMEHQCYHPSMPEPVITIRTTTDEDKLDTIIRLLEEIKAELRNGK